MQEQRTQLYMFAIMPPPPVAHRIHKEREAVAANFNFVKALKPPVHITMYDPVMVPMEQTVSFEKRAQQLHRWAGKNTPFTIDVLNYDHFDNQEHPVLFLNVVKNSSLTALHRNLLLELKKFPELEERKPRTFRPHFTIAYRDTTPEAFPNLLAFYKALTFKDSFTCDAVHLWKHDGHNWQVLDTYKLKAADEQLSLF